MKALSVFRCLAVFLAWAPVLRGEDEAPEPKTAVIVTEDCFESLTGRVGSWEMTPGVYEKTLREARPAWIDAEKTKSQIGNVHKKDGEPHKIMGEKLPVLETIVNFTESKLARVQFSLYNRGDAGEVSMTEFKRRIEEAKTAITARVGNAGQDRGKEHGAVASKGWTWKDDRTRYLLEASTKRQQGEDRPEFLRLILIPGGPEAKTTLGATPAAAKGAATATRSGLKANVKSDPKGDKYIGNVPMVDQGQKGYCVVATAERVMRYYGAEVDQHEMAQMADSSSDGGTSAEKMTEALDRIDSKFKLRLKRVMPWTVRSYLEMIKDYNRVARGAKEKLISTDEAYSVAHTYQEMDADTLKKSRATTMAMSRFQKLVRDYTESGVPLMWTVQLGIFKEGNLPQSGGGHMRLIIGYNDTTSEILYSDSWGKGHEMKRMPADEAWTMTSGLYAMEPKEK